MLTNSWQNVRKILVVRLDNVGDMIMLGPALRSLRYHLPKSSITLLASPAGSQVVPMLPWVDEVITLSPVWQDVSGKLPLDPQRELELVQKLSAENFDAAFIFTSFSQSPYPPAYVCYLAEIPIRIGQSKEFGGNILSQWVKPLPDHTHQVDRNLHLLQEAGIEAVGTDLELHLPVSAEREAAQTLNSIGVELDEPYFVIAPGASCAARRYDPKKFAEVARELSAETGWPVIMVGSAKEVELVQKIKDEAGLTSGKVLSLAGKTSVPALAAVIASSTMVITNDSGPMHLADAFCRPMVVLYSGTELEEQWRPRKAPARLLRRPTSCSPCYAFNCPYNMECLDIPAREVIDEAFAAIWSVR